MAASPPHLLIVEDRDSLRRMLERALSGEGYRVTTAGDVESGQARLAEDEFDLVLTDLRLPDASGLEVVAAARQRRPPLPVVVMTAYGTVGSAVEAMKRGALDFLEKPVELDELFELVARIAGGAKGGGDVADGDGADGDGADGDGADGDGADGDGADGDGANGDGGAVFQPPGCPAVVGRHPRLAAARHLLERVAPTDSTVLLTGESGTGKGLFAQALHGLSARLDGPFVTVNCAAIPETLIENELFGHEKGAFTGAGRTQAGRFEKADGGTLLLDEIGELPLAVQAKVLRVIEERTFERVGGGPTRSADVRLVAATNRDLAAMVEEGSFRRDLFFRLDVFPIELPPLRERASDIPALARHLLDELARRHRRDRPKLSAAAAERLRELPWPGNVRQLANVLERALILLEGDALGSAELEPLLAPLAPEAAGGRRAASRGAQREEVRRALVAADGDKRRAADELGISYRTLLRRVKEHDLEGIPHYRDGTD